MANVFAMCATDGTRQTRPLPCLALPSGVCRVFGAHGELANSGSDLDNLWNILFLKLKIHSCIPLLETKN